MSTHIEDYLFTAMVYGGAPYCLLVGAYFFASNSKESSTSKNYLLALHAIVIAALHTSIFIINETLLSRNTMQLWKEIWIWLHVFPAFLLIFGIARYSGPAKRLILTGSIVLFWMFSFGFGYLALHGK